mmetsp:Transcript_100136/g.287760  ORF Transcript_100136/g.287760 Transcript_100136/m.287760 type:complete len:260 (-) Transcript_100136:46-825(-)
MREHPLDELKLVLPGGVGQRFVDDAAGVLVQGERVEVGAEQAHDVLALLGGAMLEEVLDHEVSIGVLAQVTDVVQQIGDEDCQPLRGKELHQPLKYAAAIWMLRDGTGAAPLEQLRDDEEHVGGPHHRDRLLKHVVRVRGLKRLGDVTLELTHNQLLLGPSCLLQSALHLPAALRLQRQLQDPRAQRRRRRRRRVLRRRRRGRGGGSGGADLSSRGDTRCCGPGDGQVEGGILTRHRGRQKGAACHQRIHGPARKAVAA